MIELTWLQMAHPNFQQAVNAIWDCPMLDGSTSYTAHRIQKAIEKGDKEVRALRIELSNKWGKKGEDGKLITDDKGYITFEKPEDTGAFEKEFTEEFSKRTISLKVNKLDFQKLANVRGITPRMWEHLSVICENMPEEDNGIEIGNAEMEATPIVSRKKKRTLP